jgi:DNA-binding transcriptional MerR regulator
MSVSGRDKAADAYRTISEAADALDLPQHVLRFWETRFTQIKPRKGPGGRRYYRPADIDLLRWIRKLLYEDGLTIRGAQLALRDHPQEVPTVPVASVAVVETGGDDRRQDDRQAELQGALQELREIRRALNR